MAKEKSLSEALRGVTRFGRLVPIGEEHRQVGKGSVRYVLCRCDCGEEFWTKPDALRRGATKSCGCLTRENAKTLAVRTCLTHGDARVGATAPEYRLYRAMLNRCYNPTVERYPEYGGRGIVVCDQWRGKGGYERWLAHLGRRPAGMSLDRIETNGNYEPGNVRWATGEAQAGNRRSSRLLDDGIETLPLSAMARKYGIGRAILAWRLKHGTPLAEALTAPRRPGGYRKPA